jgi:hypothetical protein
VDRFAKLITVLGFLALLVFGLYMGIALLDTLWEIFRDFLWWFRSDFLPGAVWLVAIAVGAWILFNGGARRWIRDIFR